MNKMAVSYSLHTFDIDIPPSKREALEARMSRTRVYVSHPTSAPKAKADDPSTKKKRSSPESFPAAEALLNGSEEAPLFVEMGEPYTFTTPLLRSERVVPKKESRARRKVLPSIGTRRSERLAIKKQTRINVKRLVPAAVKDAKIPSIKKRLRCFMETVWKKNPETVVRKPIE